MTTSIESVVELDMGHDRYKLHSNLGWQNRLDKIARAGFKNALSKLTTNTESM